jgi:hypothetical protein
MPRDVFVSYSQSDRQCAFELVAHAEAEGIGCWIAPRDIAPSADWAAEIIDAIAAARIMVLVFSASSNQSPQVRREVERAVHRDLSILPFRIEDVQPANSLEFFLSTQHWLDAFPAPLEPHYRRLCAHLRTTLHTGAAPAEAAPAAPPAPRAMPSAFGEAELRQIELRLADYIGPLARHLVKRATAHALGMEDLLLRLAAELESEDDRRQFIGSCRRMERPRE